jgi:Protein of unknown function (DUF3618)
VGQAAGELRQDIERTREDMSATIDAIGDRVSPKLAAERQIGRLRESGVDPQRVVLIAAAALLGLLILRRLGKGHD